MKCPVCSSTRLSPETEAGPMGHVFRARFSIEGKLMVTQINRGRICGDCGHVILFADKTHLSKLQQAWDKLLPYES